MPRVLEGQLCYTLDMSTIQKEGKRIRTKAGMNDGLVLMIDSANSQFEDSRLTTEHENGEFFHDNRDKKVNKIKVHIETLSKINIYRPGKYAMTGLKRISGTNRFLSMSDKDKSCQLKAQTECQMERYLKTIQNQCGCVPWALSPGLPANEVSR